MLGAGVNKNFLLKRDLWVGLLIIVLGFFLLNTAQVDSKDNIVFPSAVFLVMIFTGIVISVMAIKNQKAASVKGIKVHWLEAVIFVILIASIDIISIFGFYFAVGIVTLILTILFFKDFSLKGLIKTIIYTVALTGSVYFIFSFLLRIVTPRGIFF